ncbi:germination protein PA [Bacillus sp. J14TS2]|uniref:spore germination protein n=1 Tax=unclassified Bacillus (in: firmicutes) TaxID=185979 RepID=UPI001A974C3E|nr:MULTISPECIES: spore germination protein [unclassified Bacillus (in: firmicutes)]MBO0993650.1 spore germination protein [Bacillus sp. SD088]GIN74064.1 germination protein PA [Bacillus sp. J14TS2]
MPGFVGAVQIISISGSGIFNVGDVFQLHPVSSSKVFAGAGSFNTGDEITVTNHYSATNTYDNDTLDQGIMFTL